MDYNHTESERKWLKFWEDNKIYKFKHSKKVYSIDTPPPTVSGKMHIGHAFSYAQQDFIARFRRMMVKGSGLFYPFGTDDNGLPTERLVEKLKGVKSKNMSRQEFIELCLKTLKEITPGFVQDWKNIGVSSDFDIFYSTIDDNSRKISQKSFLDLYRAKQAYKKEFPSIWCPECQTSIAQAELEDREKASQFNTIRFDISGKPLNIATTRPELLGACVAIFVNPQDKRYKGMIGKKAKVPLFDLKVPVISDKSADMEKGTGAMMICSYGDKYDVDAIQRHKLKPRIIFDRQGCMKPEILNYIDDEEFKTRLRSSMVLDALDAESIKIKEFRNLITDYLESKNLISDKKQITHVVNVHDKCGTEIEFLPTEQWFIKILDKKKQLISQGKKVKWYPKHMRKRYENWIKGLSWDWTISRDRHFGVPIPVWYCETCRETILPSEKELPVDPTETKKTCKKCNLMALGEKKVLDTWATSSLTPEITSSLAGNKIKIPYSLRPQAHDIIRTWAFYTIVKAYLHEKKIPWKDIVISGFVTLKGEKMSKSKGNVITPQEILKKHGADSLRFWAAGSKLGEDLDYQEKEIMAGKRLVTKLINASRFVFMNLKDFSGKKPKKLEKIDELFLTKLNRVIESVTKNFMDYEYSKAKLNVEEFFWKDFADNYLEIVKKRVYNETGDKKASAQYTLYTSLLAIIKMIAPIMPFITEEIYQKHFRKFEKDKSIHISAWPEYKKVKEKKIVKKYEDEELGWDKWNLLIKLISKIRSIKTKAKKPMNAEIILELDRNQYDEFEDFLEDLKNVTNAKEIKEGRFKVDFL